MSWQVKEDAFFISIFRHQLIIALGYVLAMCWLCAGYRDKQRKFRLVHCESRLITGRAARYLNAMKTFAWNAVTHFEHPKCAPPGWFNASSIILSANV